MVHIKKAVEPAPYIPSSAANYCEKHYYQLKDACSVDVKELFPSITKAIYNHGDDLKIIEEATRKALEKVDMSMIKPYDRVNLTASEHGFAIMGGLPYLTMVKTIKDVVEERTHNYRIRVVMAMYRLPVEAKEVIDYFDLENFLGCEVIGTCPFDEGVGIDTRIGKFWGNKVVYDCDHMIYAYYDDPREQYLHRGNKRTFKSFVMNFARVETRTSFHMLSDGWCNSVIPQAIYDSDFVQKRWTFACILNTAPTGVYGITADNSLYNCEEVTEVHMLKDYTFIRLLFKNLDPWIAIWDGGKWGSYLHTAGMIYGCCSSAGQDYFNMEIPYANAKEKGQSECKGGTSIAAGMTKSKQMVGVIMNQSWTGLIQWFMPHQTPFYCVGQEQLDMHARDRNNQGPAPGMSFADGVKNVHETLEEAMEKAQLDSGSSNLIAFDGSFDHINCSHSAAEDIIRHAEGIEEETFEEHLPQYLKQRGFDVEKVYREIYHREYKGCL